MITFYPSFMPQYSDCLKTDFTDPYLLFGFCLCPTVHEKDPKEPDVSLCFPQVVIYICKMRNLVQ